MDRFASLVLATSLAFPLAAGAQSTAVIGGQSTAPATAQNFPAQVLALAPQLVNFAGSTANFQNLVNGLAQGTPVTLVGITPDGFEQTATFTPSGTLGTTQIAQALEQARQQLITRGIAAPSPEQLGTALVGGPLATPAGTTTVPGVLATPTASSAGSASTGASSPGAASGLQVQVRPVAAQAGPLAGTLPAQATTSASPIVTNTSDSPAPTHTSDSPFLGNTSDSPLPPTAVPSAGASSGIASPGAVTNTSPAAQMQNRR